MPDLDGHLVEAEGQLANHRGAGYAVRLQVEPTTKRRPRPLNSQYALQGCWSVKCPINRRFEVTLHFSGYGCRLNRSMQRSSNLLIRWCFSKRPDPLGCTQLNLDRAVFSLNQRSRTNLAVETPADWTSGRCCVDPLRPPR
jgi:hypothetical protein